MQGGRERSETQERARWEALGRLAGPVLHDLNNLLMWIEGEAEMMLLEGKAEEEGLSRILEAARAAATLTRGMLSGVRTSEGPVEVVDIEGRVDWLAPLLKKLGGKSLELQRMREAQALVAPARRPELDQVLLNLFTNAVDAMGGAGRVVIRTEGAGRRLVVEDNGPGIAPEIVERIFEPYFTTKTESKGTGMGLALAREAVAGWGAELCHEPVDGGGARFVIAWPKPVEGRGQRVLLVEDEPALRGLLGRALRQQGYTVSEAARGEEALAMIAAGEPFDLLVTDLELPDRPGREVRAAMAEAPALLISGYPVEVMGRGEVALEKPFSTKALVLAVQHLLKSQ